MGANFKPMYWSKYCQTELKKDLVLSGWCDYQFEGEVKLGSRLKIVGATRPTIQQYTPGKDLDIENLGDNSQYLDITQADAFAFEDVARFDTGVRHDPLIVGVDHLAQLIVGEDILRIGWVGLQFFP